MANKQTDGRLPSPGFVHPENVCHANSHRHRHQRKLMCLPSSLLRSNDVCSSARYSADPENLEKVIADKPTGKAPGVVVMKSAPKQCKCRLGYLRRDEDEETFSMCA